MDATLSFFVGGSATEARVCGNCLAPEDEFGVTLIVCPRCKLTLYCSNYCQTADWMAGHKQHCLTPEQRRVLQQAKAPGPGTRASSARAEQGPIELPVRLDMAFVQEAFAAGLDAACQSDDEEDVEPYRTRKQPKLHSSSSSYDGGSSESPSNDEEDVELSRTRKQPKLHSSSSYDGGSSGEDGTSIAEEDVEPSRASIAETAEAEGFWVKNLCSWQRTKPRGIKVIWPDGHPEAAYAAWWEGSLPQGPYQPHKVSGELMTDLALDSIAGTLSL
jgi:MYND finger